MKRQDAVEAGVRAVLRWVRPQPGASESVRQQVARRLTSVVIDAVLPLLVTGYVVVDDLGNQHGPAYANRQAAQRMADWWNSASHDLYSRPRLGVRFSVAALIPVEDIP